MTVEQRVQMLLGEKDVMIVSLSVQLEQAKAELAKLKPADEKPAAEPVA